MLKQKIISAFLILVLSILALPIQQIGSILYQNQLTEEISHADSADMAKKPFESLHKHFDYTTQETFLSGVADRVSAMIHIAEKLYSRHSDDIQTPPPNC